MIKLTTLPQGEVYVVKVPRDSKGHYLLERSPAYLGYFTDECEWAYSQHIAFPLDEVELLGVIGEEISPEDWKWLVKIYPTAASLSYVLKSKGIDLKENKYVLILKKI